MRKTSLLIYCIGLCLAIATVGSSAIANDKKAAKAAFEEAKSLYGDKMFAQAADAFRKAYDLNPSWKLLYNIGQSEAAAKRHGLALEVFEQYLSEGGDDVKQKRQKEVGKEIKRLREMVGSIDVKSPAGTVISVDEVKRGTAPLTGHILVAAGVDHKVIAVLEGDTIIERDIRVTGGQVMVIEPQEDEPEPVKDDATPEEDQAEPLPAEDSGSPLRTAGWVTLGVGAAVMIGGAVTGGMALSANGNLEESCDNLSCASDVDSEIEKKRDKLALATDILLPIGGVVAGTGIILLIVDAVRAGKSEGTDNTSAKLRPVISPVGVGLMIERSF